jgi:hypothetical protein
MIFQLFANAHIIFASSSFMPFYHNMVFSEHFYVFEEVMINVVDLMIHVLLEEIYELVGIPHDLGLGLPWSRSTLVLIQARELSEEPVVQSVAEHVPLDRFALRIEEIIGQNRAIDCRISHVQLVLVLPKTLA